MGSIVSSLTGGGGSGLGYQAKGANILEPATVAQANQTYQEAQDALQNQSNFVGATAAQNGLGNQSSVFNQLQGVANGTGPNPAQAQLAQATGANISNQASLMAGQRGSSANTGLIARQAALQGGNIQQQSAGQAATLQAQQSLGALGQLGGIAGQQVGQQANAMNAYSQAAQGEQSNILNAIAQQNNANVGMQSNMNSNNATIANTAAQQQGNLVGNIAGGVGAALLLADGGPVAKPKMAYGGVNPVTPSAPGSGPVSNAGQFFNQGVGGLGSTIGKAIGSGLNSAFDAADTSLGITDYGQAVKEGNQEMDQEAADNAQHASMMTSTPGQGIGNTPMMAKGGNVKAKVSPGEKVLNPKQADAVKKGKVNPMHTGKTVPGKPKVGGAKNSYANDTVDMTLKEGGLVIPRSVTQSHNPEQKALEFVRQVYAQRKRGI